MTPLTRALEIAAQEAAAASQHAAGMEKVRLRSLSDVLEAEARIAAQKAAPCVA